MLYVVTTAASVILIRVVSVELPDMLMVFLTTTYAIVVFQAINARHIVPMYRALVRHHKLAYLQLLVTQLIVWLGTFLIPAYFMPSSLLITTAGVASLCGCASVYFATRRMSVALHGALLALSLALFYLLYTTRCGGWMYLVFVASTLVVGLAAFAGLRFSSNILDRGLTASQVLVARFWLLWLISLVYVIWKNELPRITLNAALDTGVLGLVSVILPIYFLQKSVEVLGTDRTGIFLGFAPLAVVALEYVFLNELDEVGAVPAALLPAITIAFALYEHHRKPATIAKTHEIDR